MQVTLDSGDSLENALRVLGALYGVTLTVASDGENAAESAADNGTGAQERPARSRRGSRTTASRSRRRGAAASTPDLAAVRAWARENGYTVSDRGRVPNSILAAYQESVGSA